ncbi:MAG: FAD-binding protein [Chloroflexi bacterium]|nr:FAD-binding protein [Chloroflexota bacterium]
MTATLRSIDRRVVRRLERAVGRNGVLWRPEEIIAFEYDGTIERAQPQAVVFPTSSEQVSQVVRIALDAGLPVTPRGAGTGLSGGAVAALGGVVVALTRMKRIIEIDTHDRLAIVEPGVVNVDLSKAAAPFDLYYAPDPSSQRVCTLGGNVAENAGGPHCLAYGVTTNHVLGLEVVLPNGEIAWLGGRARQTPGYDLRGVFVGSEGTLGIATKIVLRLLRRPEATHTLLAIFDEVAQASEAVSAIIGHGIVPSALEMIDREVIRAVEPALHVGYPLDAGAVLLIEVDGLRETVAEEAAAIREVCDAAGAREVREAQEAAERERLWAGRKGAIGALGRLAPNYYVLDGVVPRTKLPEVLRKVYETAERYGFPVANVFHAGDGNLHPNILFDSRKPGETARVLEAGAEIMRLCVDAGGTISGEHGIGLEKRSFMDWIFTEEDIAAMAKVKAAFGGSDLYNPCKIFPTGKGCGEVSQANIERVMAQAGPDAYI